jgi:hypothetical protein
MSTPAAGDSQEADRAEVGNQPAAEAPREPGRETDAESGPSPESGRGGDGSSPGQRWNGNASGIAPPADPNAKDKVGVSNAAEESLDSRYDERENQNRRVRSDFPGRRGPDFDIHGQAQIRDIAGHDINNNYYFAWGEARARGPISTVYLYRAAQVHVPTSSESALIHACAEDQVVFLRGRIESGRRSSAVAALDELTGRQRRESRVTVVEAAAGLGGLASRLREGHGHLLDASSAEWVETVSEAQVAEARAALEPGGYLIILVDSSISRSLPSVTTDHLPPDPRKVLLSHLAAKLRASQDRAADGYSADQVLQAALNASSEAREWLDEITGKTGRAEAVPAEAVHLAECIWAWHGQRFGASADGQADQPEPQVRLFREMRLSQQARGLLRRGERNDSPLRQAYVISAAVLDGLAVSDVADGARQLAALLQEVEHPGGSEGRQIFAEPLARWLSHVAMASGASGPTDGATAGGSTMAHMPSRRLARAVIEAAWLDYDAVRLPLLDWLAQLCSEHQDERVRIRATQALAFIARHDYPQIRDRVLYPWSDSGRPIQHQAAAWLLEAATLDGAVVDRVQALLWRWSRSGDREKRAIAVRAYGTAAAKPSPEEAIRGVRFSAADTSFGALPELALREMYVLGLHQEVLKELTFWTRAFPPMRERAGRVLIRIARVTRTSDNGQDDSDNGTGRKAVCFDLLWRMANEPDKTGIDLLALASLWRLACLQPGSRGAAWQMLGFWAQSCRHEPGLRDTFNQLIDKFEQVADQPELRARLRVYRRRWSTYRGQEDQR